MGQLMMFQLSTQKQQMKTVKFQLIKAKPITLNTHFEINTEPQKRKI
jgi:hypothetical protein